jgi:hypothetical protein
MDAPQATGGNGGAGGVNCLPDEHMCAGECFKNSDPRTCGACNHDCTSLANVKPGSVQCQAGKCVAPADGCLPGHGHCTANPDDICETDLTAIANCGRCGNNCPPTAPFCSNGGGTQTCVLDCGGTTPDKCGTTCLDLKTDVANCGACDQVCTFPNATASCVNRVCTSRCDTGFGDCNAQPGCETALNVDNNCGSCGNACPANFKCNASTRMCVDICTLGGAGTTSHCCNSSICPNSLACVSGVCKTTCAADSDCQPGNACSTGRCLPSGSFCDATHPCAAGFNCTGGRCAPCGASGQACCTAGSACQPNLTCGSGNTCQCGGIGQACCSSGTPCTDDGNRCNGPEVCQGTCQHGTPVVCSASNICHNVGVCNPATGICTDPPKTNGTACGASSDPCRAASTCQGGTCTQGMLIPCPSGQMCVGGMCVCNPALCPGNCCLNNQCATPKTCFPDNDGDTYGSSTAQARTFCMAACPTQFSTNNRDCCDEDPNAKPGAFPGANDFAFMVNACGTWEWNCTNYIEQSVMEPDMNSCGPLDPDPNSSTGCAPPVRNQQFKPIEMTCGRSVTATGCFCSKDAAGTCVIGCGAGGLVPQLGCK